jgi:acyl-CoA reductase-like NAD-dependent aldehyde dehydrogenase
MGGRSRRPLIQVENPAKRTMIGEVPRAGAAEVDRAVRAAAKAFESWKVVQPRERGRLLMKIADAMDAESEAIGRLIATETGNALRTQSRPEAKGAADLLRYFGGLASEVKGETVPLGEHVLSYTRREPIGVVGAIIPWNSPVILGAMKIAMSLAAGNTLVLKAAEDAPLGVLKMAELCAQHLPAGVLNVVTGYGERRAPRSSSIRWCASSRSPDRPRSASSSCTRPPTASSRFPGTRRQKPLHRLSRRDQRRGRGRRRDRHAFHAPGPVLHRRLTPFPA